MFSINSLTGFSVITRHVWQGYSLPTKIRFTNLGNIPSSIEVSMYLKTAFNTVERIAFPVAFIDMSAVRTFLTGISWVDGYHGFSSSFSLISEKLLKLIETPVVKFSGKLNSFSSALNSYTGKVFNSEYIERHSHNFLRDVMIYPGNKPFFLSTDLPKKLLSGTSAFALEFRSKVCVLSPYIFDRLAIEKSIIGSYCNINYPPINSKNLITGRFGRLFSDSYMQIKSILLFVIFKCGSSQFPIKILPVVFRNRERSFYSAFSGCKSNNLFREVDVANSFVISDTRELFDSGKFFKLDTFKSFTGSISNPLKNRAGKLWIFTSDVIVSSMMDRYFTASMVLKTIFSNLIKDTVAKVHGLSESFLILLRQFQFKFNRSIHIHILPLINVNGLWYLGGGVHFLSAINCRVSATPAPRRTQ